MKRLIRNANFDQSYACIADINYSAGRKLNKAQINRLATCEYIAYKHNIIIMGAAGAGKSYFACAFGMKACKQYYNYYTVKYVRLPELLTDPAVVIGEGIYKKGLNQYRKVTLLILDEWMLVSLTETGGRDVLEIIHDIREHSTIFWTGCSPLRNR